MSIIRRTTRASILHQGDKMVVRNHQEQGEADTGVGQPAVARPCPRGPGEDAGFRMKVVSKMESLWLVCSQQPQPPASPRSFSSLWRSGVLSPTLSPTLWPTRSPLPALLPDPGWAAPPRADTGPQGLVFRPMGGKARPSHSPTPPPGGRQGRRHREGPGLPRGEAWTAAGQPVAPLDPGGPGPGLTSWAAHPPGRPDEPGSRALAVVLAGPPPPALPKSPTCGSEGLAEGWAPRGRWWPPARPPRPGPGKRRALTADAAVKATCFPSGCASPRPG